MFSSFFFFFFFTESHLLTPNCYNSVIKKKQKVMRKQEKANYELISI